MRMPDIDRDPPRDPEVGAWLRASAPPDVDGLAGLRAAIRERAALPLAARRVPRWWEVAAGWARPAIPLAAAAGLALAVAVGSLPVPAAPGGANTAATLPHLDDALAAGIPDAEYRLLTSEGAEPDALLQFAVQEF
jgi:hypothetical protein